VPQGVVSGTSFYILVDERGNYIPEALPARLVGTGTYYDVGQPNPQMMIIPRIDSSYCITWGVLEALVPYYI